MRRGAGPRREDQFVKLRTGKVIAQDSHQPERERHGAPPRVARGLEKAGDFVARHGAHLGPAGTLWEPDVLGGVLRDHLPLHGLPERSLGRSVCQARHATVPIRLHLSAEILDVDLGWGGRELPKLEHAESSCAALEGCHLPSSSPCAPCRGARAAVATGAV